MLIKKMTSLVCFLLIITSFPIVTYGQETSPTDDYLYTSAPQNKIVTDLGDLPGTYSVQITQENDKYDPNADQAFQQFDVILRIQEDGHFSFLSINTFIDNKLEGIQENPDAAKWMVNQKLNSAYVDSEGNLQHVSNPALYRVLYCSGYVSQSYGQYEFIFRDKFSSDFRNINPIDIDENGQYLPNPYYLRSAINRTGILGEGNRVGLSDNIEYKAGKILFHFSAKNSEDGTKELVRVKDDTDYEDFLSRSVNQHSNDWRKDLKEQMPATGNDYRYQTWNEFFQAVPEAYATASPDLYQDYWTVDNYQVQPDYIVKAVNPKKLIQLNTTNYWNGQFSPEKYQNELAESETIYAFDKKQNKTYKLYIHDDIKKATEYQSQLNLTKCIEKLSKENIILK